MIEIKAPSPGESISEVEIAAWLKNDGEFVQKDEVICEIESDKATLTVAAEAAGVLHTQAAVEDIVAVGAVIAKIDTNAEAPVQAAATAETPAPQVEEAAPAAAPAAEAAPKQTPAPVEVPKASGESSFAAGTPSPSAAKLMAESGVQADAVAATGKGGRITKQDVVATIEGGGSAAAASSVVVVGGSREVRRKKMSMLRRSVAERLVAAKNQTAMLTTFNEVDMSGIMNLRKRYKESFAERYNINLGFMSFFVKAAVEALQEYPAVNGMIDGREVVYHDYVDMGIAVSAPKGLMVPVIRNAEQLGFAEIEASIKELALKARDNALSLEEMSGGTFTISNGGIFGSMLSTPILNPPQCGILGMHNIVERPVVVDGEVVVRPIMYLALSYDHRIIDGRESVGFLLKIKNLLEDPNRLLLGV